MSRPIDNENAVTWIGDPSQVRKDPKISSVALRDYIRTHVSRITPDLSHAQVIGLVSEIGRAVESAQDLGNRKRGHTVLCRFLAGREALNAVDKARVTLLGRILYDAANLLVAAGINPVHTLVPQPLGEPEANLVDLIPCKRVLPRSVAPILFIQARLRSRRDLYRDLGRAERSKPTDQSLDFALPPGG